MPLIGVLINLTCVALGLRWENDTFVVISSIGASATAFCVGLSVARWQITKALESRR